MPQVDGYIGLAEAQARVEQLIQPLAPLSLPVDQAAGLVAAREARSQVASPSITACSKDGFAVRGEELAQASEEAPVALTLAGSVAAGEQARGELQPGQAIKVTTGAPLPPGADAVLAVEFSRTEGDTVYALASADPGRNVLARGSDVAPDQLLVSPGQRLTPPRLGLAAAGGAAELWVHPLPKVGLLATGREVVAPGRPLPSGGVYASNLVALSAWLGGEGMSVESRVVDDDAGQISSAAHELIESCDALLTSGGAWLSGRDLVVGALEELGLALSFRRVRMGPGKGVAFGLLAGKPVFCLPGGPPSNEMAFLQLALPGLLRLAGRIGPIFPLAPARLGKAMSGEADWSQLSHGLLEPGTDLAQPPIFNPLPLRGRLLGMTQSQALACLPEGVERWEAGQVITVQLMPPGE